MAEKRHIEIALELLKDYTPYVKDFIKVNPIDMTVCFKIQSKPIGEVGIDGVQVVDLIAYSKHLIASLNTTTPCPYNEISIRHLEEVLEVQRQRIVERSLRGVEGTPKV
jgi:hypothetical protein